MGCMFSNRLPGCQMESNDSIDEDDNGRKVKPCKEPKGKISKNCQELIEEQVVFAKVERNENE